MRISISLALAEIEKSINHALGEVLHEGTTPEGMHIRVLKRGHIVLGEIPRPDRKGSFYTDRIRATAPIAVEVDASQHASLGLLDKLPGVDTDQIDFELRVQFDVQFSVAPHEWDINTSTTATFIFDKNPTVGIGLMDVSVSRIVGRMVRKQLEEVCAEIDRYLKHDIRVRDYVRLVWQTVAQPFQVEQQPPTWVYFAPAYQQYGTELSVAHHALHWLIHAVGEVRCTIGEPSSLPAAKIPRLHLQENLSALLSELPIAAEISYSALEKMICQQPEILGNGYRLQITGFLLQPESEHAFTATVSGTLRIGKKWLAIPLRATIQLRGDISVQDARLHVALTDIQVMKGSVVSSLLLKSISAGWKVLLESSINDALKEQQEMLLQLIQKQLTHYPIENVSIVRGTIAFLVPHTIQLSTQQIRLTGVVAGTASAEILIPLL